MMREEDLLMRACGWIVGVVLLACGCTVSGSGKASKPGWKITKTEHARAVPAGPVRSGQVELRVNQVFLEEHKTVIETKYWKGVVRGTIVSAAALPAEDLSDDFTLIGTSGKTYRANVMTLGSGRSTWQHQEHTGKPTHLPANVPGEIEIWAQIGDEKTHDELAAFTFGGVRVALSR
jgi:hypothetical protein